MSAWYEPGRRPERRLSDDLAAAWRAIAYVAAAPAFGVGVYTELAGYPHWLALAAGVACGLGFPCAWKYRVFA